MSTSKKKLLSVFSISGCYRGWSHEQDMVPVPLELESSRGDNDKSAKRNKGHGCGGRCSEENEMWGAGEGIGVTLVGGARERDVLAEG